jgi:hypothetical protein
VGEHGRRGVHAGSPARVYLYGTWGRK